LIRRDTKALGLFSIKTQEELRLSDSSPEPDSAPADDRGQANEMTIVK
jgi:hypothetical protein